MSAKKWCFCFLGTIVLLAVLLGAFNVWTDPFGVFGDRFFQWYSYDETNNPRAAKIAYLEQHHDEYDSYIIGCSSTSSFPTAQLNEYYDASFYNLIMYGADMLDVEQTVDYLIEQYTVKHLVLNVYIDNGTSYDYESNAYTDAMHPAVDGSSKLKFYSRYLTANPSYGIAKLHAWREDTWLQQSFDVFDEETGAYDKTKRDIESIGDLETYLAAYPVFTNYPTASYGLYRTAQCMQSVANIKAACEAAGVDLIVVCAPVYADYLAHFTQSDVEQFYTALAQVTDFWDFSYSSVSFEPRYFYDATHFRNAVGAMALAYMNGDESVYRPSDFGAYVTADNVQEYFATQYWDAAPLDETELTAEVPILMYHHITDENSNSVTITAENFEAQIAALAEAGYTAISFDELLAYVNEGADLPDKPIVITFDDGYLSNYEIAFPILEQYGMHATIFAIGSSLGKDTYKDTDNAIIPHFTAEQAAEMVQSGVIDIQSHTYDMHQSELYETGQARTTVAQFDGESEADYIAALRADFAENSSLLESATGQKVQVLAYPQGVYSDLTQAVFAQEGATVTLGTSQGCNTVVRGLPQTLFGMHRYGINDDVSVEELLSYVEPARG
jgi:peptidoglycan/xylan/chitin deacetylase (PgdA/CDA1 family)